MQISLIQSVYCILILYKISIRSYRCWLIFLNKIFIIPRDTIVPPPIPPISVAHIYTFIRKNGEELTMI